MIFGRTILQFNSLSRRTSLMTSLVRPLLSSILCCMIAFGHLPAWLHVATCGDGCGNTPVAVAEDTSCSHGCCHHSDDSAEPNSLPEAPADHDSDSCAACQSLASSIGVVSLSETTLAREYVCEPVFARVDRDPIGASFSIAQPRGPPTLA